MFLSIGFEALNPIVPGLEFNLYLAFSKCSNIFGISTSVEVTKLMLIPLALAPVCSELKLLNINAEYLNLALQLFNSMEIYDSLFRYISLPVG